MLLLQWVIVGCRWCRDVCCGQLLSMSNYIEREVVRRAFVMERWNMREKEKIEHEAELKKRAAVRHLTSPYRAYLAYHPGEA